MFVHNMGTLDRAIRLTVGVVVATVGLFVLNGLGGGILGLGLAAIAVMPLGTGATGICPLYVPLGISTLTHDPYAQPQRTVVVDHHGLTRAR